MKAIGLFLSVLLQISDPVVSRVGFEQKLGASLDRSIVLRDEDGQPVRVGDLFKGRSIVLTPVYYECPMLCSMQLNGLVRALKVMRGSAGKEFDVLTFSIDAGETPETARERKARYAREYGRPGAAAGWRFLTGDAESIERLAENIGFRFTRNPATGQIAHASVLVTLTPDGRVAQYFGGIEYDPAELEESLRKASAGKTGSLIDRVLLYCYEYDPSTGRYSLAVLRAARLGGVATLCGLVALAWWSSRRRRLA
jgi:protein SCO1/2